MKRWSGKPRPSKICFVCQREMQWRKRWARVWNEVRYCSKACRRKRAAGSGGAA